MSPGPSLPQQVQRHEQDMRDRVQSEYGGSQPASEDEGDGMETTSGRSSVDYTLGTNERALIRETILKCYADVWREFYEWEPDDSLRILRSLASTGSHVEAVHEACEDDWPSVSHKQQRDSDRDTGYDSSDMEFDLYEWDSDGIIHSSSMPPPVIVTASTAVVPHPKYEACAPAYTSIALEVSDGWPECRFIKHADEAGFDKCAHLRKFCAILWQKPGRDPNHRLIASVTIQRLTAWARKDAVYSAGPVPIYLEDIDDSGVFSMYENKRHKSSVCSDIIHKMRQRDQLVWPGDKSAKTAIFQYQSVRRSLESQGDQARLTSLAASFCPDLGCLRASCFQHPYPTGWVWGTSMDAELTHEALLTDKKVVRLKHCSDDCYRSVDIEALKCSVDWAKEPEVDIIDLLLAVEPDTQPCALVRLLPLTECWKIYLRRCETVNVSRKSHKLRAVSPGLYADLSDEPLSFTIPVRCQHDGPCSSFAKPKCVCFDRKVHCGRNCLCSEKCKMRFKGCNCGQRYLDCNEKDSDKRYICQCQQANRECDLEHCQHTKSKSTPGGKCPNFAMQIREPPHLIVKSGMYGLGVFAGEAISAHAFLGEYVGELCPVVYADIRRDNHNQSMNYDFQLNGAQTLNAQNYGNETMYFNHADGSKANVDPCIKLVNGEQKIGFFTKKQVAKGEELFFNYGRSYWENA